MWVSKSLREAKSVLHVSHRTGPSLITSSLGIMSLFASVANALGLVALLASFLALTIEIRVRGDKVLLFFTKLPFLPDSFSLLTCLFFALVVNMNSSSLNY